VVPDAIDGKIAQRVIEGFDVTGGPSAAILDAQLRFEHVVHRQMRIVDLENEAAPMMALYSSRRASPIAIRNSSSDL
jgi:hypothetical protein